ncbi:uncharacterized protein ACN63O_010998 [Diretmus argenteus]
MTTKVLFAKEGGLYRGSENSECQEGVKMHQGEVDQDRSQLNKCAIRCKAFGIASTNTKSCFDVNDNVTTKRQIKPGDDKEVECQSTDGGKELLVNRCSYFYSNEEVTQTCDGMVKEVSINQTQSSVNGHIGSKQKAEESVNGQMKSEQVTPQMDAVTEKLEAKNSYMLGYFAGKLSEAYKDASRRLQSTRDSIGKLKDIQVSLAGQHVRLSGCTEDTILAVFTHSKELTQQLCKALLKVLAPEKEFEVNKEHPLLHEDLMNLSLDWTASVPDLILDNGIRVTSRFKRVLADLLYIVHGNMDQPGRPSLADIRPFLYTSVKVKNSTSVEQDTIFQLLLTDTHVVLLREDGVFHPVPRGSSLVPIHAQFQGLELRKRSDIRCLLVRQSDNCLVVDIVFTVHKAEKNMKSTGGAAEVPSISDDSSRCDSWKLSFGCTPEAVILIQNLCT